MNNDSGALSFDLIAGFAIFMIAFIWVISLVPGILIGLQAYTIDYDAVAYRTGVILVEDPGEIGIGAQGVDKTLPWENQNLEDHSYTLKVARFGLATSRDTPNILSQDKIDRFFNKTIFWIPDDYREKVIFGDYDYKFNISLHDIERNKNISVATRPLPAVYGYSRRLVKIRSTSNTTIDKSKIADPTREYMNTGDPDGLNATTHLFSVLVDTPMLFTQEPDPVYRIDPLKAPIMINISDLSDPGIKSNQSADCKINLTKIAACYFVPGLGNIEDPQSAQSGVILSVDGSYAELPAEVKNNISITIQQAVFQRINFGISDSGQYLPVHFNLTFDVVGGGNSTFLNNTWSNTTFIPSPFVYDHNRENVTQPQLRDAVVEVAVW